MVAHDNDTALPAGPDRLGLLTRTLLTKRIKMLGLIIFREDIVDDLENAPQTFIGLLKGKNFGKLIIRVANG